MQELLNPHHRNQNFTTLLKLGKMNSGAHFLLAVAILALGASISSAYDPSPLQDFCVGIDDPKKACTHTSNFHAATSIFFTIFIAPSTFVISFIRIYILLLFY